MQWSTAAPVASPGLTRSINSIRPFPLDLERASHRRPEMRTARSDCCRKGTYTPMSSNKPTKRGRPFELGNHSGRGRPPGSGNKSNLALDEMFDGKREIL